MKYAIIMSVNETDRIAEYKARTRGVKYIGKKNGSYCCVIEEFDDKKAANKALADIAFEDADSDPNISPNFHSWSLFCASIPNRAYTNKWDGCRTYYDGDCTKWRVEQLAQKGE